MPWKFKCESFSRRGVLRGLTMGDRSLNWVPPAQMQGKVKAVEVLEAQSHMSEE